MGNPRAVGAQTRIELQALTQLAARLVVGIPSRYCIDEAMPPRDMATGSGVPKAMMVKVTGKLGFAGFRQGLAGDSGSDAAALPAEIERDDTSDEIVQNGFRTAVQAQQETSAIPGLAAFDRAADDPRRARRRDFRGLGQSARIARDVRHRFLRIGIKSDLFGDTHMTMILAGLLGPDAVSFAFSHSGNTSAVIYAVKLARKNGARTIAVTNHADSPLAHLVGLVLCSTARKNPRPGENATARIARFVAVARRDRAAANSNPARTMPAVQAKRKQ